MAFLTRVPHSGKPPALLCHAPAATCAAKNGGGSWPFVPETGETSASSAVWKASPIARRESAIRTRSAALVPLRGCGRGSGRARAEGSECGGAVVDARVFGAVASCRIRHRRSTRGKQLHPREPARDRNGWHSLLHVLWLTP